MPYFVLGAGANCNGPKMRFAVIRRRKKNIAGPARRAPVNGERGALFCPLACAHGAWCPRKKNGSAQFGAADVKKARGWGQIREKKGQTTCKVRAYHVKSME